MHRFGPPSALLGTANVAKNPWWYTVCPKHGEQPHLLVLGGHCEKCVQEREEAAKNRSRNG